MKRTVSQLSSCRTVPTTGSFGKHSQSGTLHNYLPGHTPLDMQHDTAHVQVTRLMVKHTTVVGTQQQVSTWQVKNNGDLPDLSHSPTAGYIKY